MPEVQAAAGIEDLTRYRATGQANPPGSGMAYQTESAAPDRSRAEAAGQARPRGRALRPDLVLH